MMCLASGRIESRHCFHVTGIKKMCKLPKYSGFVSFVFPKEVKKEKKNIKHQP